MKERQLGLERIVFFSDAVFAIAITLLALDLKLPDQSTVIAAVPLSHSLWELWPHTQNYIISFFIIGFYWLGHHHFFNHIQRYDYPLAMFNIGLLMCIAALPFSTTVMDSYGDRRSGVAFYAATMALTGFMISLTWWYASRNHRLIDRCMSQRQVHRLTCYTLIPPMVFVSSMGLALINPTLAQLSWILIAILFLGLRRQSSLGISRLGPGR